MYKLMIATAAASNGNTSAQGGNAGQKPVELQPDNKGNSQQQPQQQQRGGDFLTMWLPFILIFVVMIFFMSRSQKKQMQKRQEMMDKIAKGTKVLLTSGIYGTVDAVNENSMIVEIASGVKIKVAKAGIAGIDSPVENAKPESGKSEGK